MSEQELNKKHRSLCKLLEDNGEDIRYSVGFGSFDTLIVKDMRQNGMFYSHLCAAIAKWANENDMVWGFYAPGPWIYLSENI